MCKECGGSGICQHRRIRCQCKECANVYIGRTTAKQLYDHSVCEGTVVGFKAGKYTICYKDNTTATLTKTALVKTLSPVVVEVVTAAATAITVIEVAPEAALVPAMPVAAEGHQITKGQPDDADVQVKMEGVKTKAAEGKAAKVQPLML